MQLALDVPAHRPAESGKPPGFAEMQHPAFLINMEVFIMFEGDQTERQTVSFQGPPTKPVNQEKIEDQKPGEAKPAETQDQQPQYLTRQEAQRLLDEVEKRAVSRAQGLVDKSGDRVMKKIQADIASLEQGLKLQRDMGLTVTPEQEEAMKAKLIQTAMTAPLPEEKPAESAQATSSPAIDPITADAIRLQEAAGTWIVEGDPELSAIKTSGSPYEFLKSVETAIAAKKQRTQSPPQPERTATNAGAGASGSAIPEGLKAIDYFSMAYRDRKP